MKYKWRILKIIITMSIFGFLLSFSLKRFNNMPIGKIMINLITLPEKEKVYFIEEDKVKKFILDKYPTKLLGDLDIHTLEKEIHHFPSVDSANVFLQLNGVLNVDIVQKIPAFRLQTPKDEFYVTDKGIEFPISKFYSHPCMLVVGNVPREDYPGLLELVKYINKDNFSKKYFIGIALYNKDYFLLTSMGNFKVELGKLENIPFKIQGFKAFAEKILIYQDPQKYSKISLKYDNQIVTTLNPNYKENVKILKPIKNSNNDSIKIIKNKTNQ